jgi:hypothetical protein
LYLINYCFFFVSGFSTKLTHTDKMHQLRVCKTLLLQLLFITFVTHHHFVTATSENENINNSLMDNSRTNGGRSLSDNDMVAVLRQQTEDGQVGVAPMMAPEYFAQLKRSWKNLQGGWGKRSGEPTVNNLEELSDYLDATKDSHASIPIEDYINAIAIINGGSNYASEASEGNAKLYEAKRAWKNMNSSWGKRLANGGGAGNGGGANWNKFRGN